MEGALNNKNEYHFNSTTSIKYPFDFFTSKMKQVNILEIQCQLSKIFANSQWRFEILVRDTKDKYHNQISKVAHIYFYIFINPLDIHHTIT